MVPFNLGTKTREKEKVYHLYVRDNSLCEKNVDLYYAQY